MRFAPYCGRDARAQGLRHDVTLGSVTFLLRAQYQASPTSNHSTPLQALPVVQNGPGAHFPMFIATEHRERLKWHRGADGMLSGFV